MTYDNNMSGILSKNDRKEKDSHPDIKGQCEINGKTYWISGWKKNKKDNSGSFYSLSFKAKDEISKPALQKSSPQKQSTQSSGFDDMDSDIPF